MSRGGVSVQRGLFVGKSSGTRIAGGLHPTGMLSLFLLVLSPKTLVNYDFISAIQEIYVEAMFIINWLKTIEFPPPQTK